MGAGLAAFVDKKKLALASAKLRAWWDGSDFDEEAVLAAISAVVEAEAAAAPATGETSKPEGADESAIEDALFDPIADPRLQALQLIWGEGRIAPGDDADEAALLAKLAVPDGGALALMGPGLIQPVRAFAGSRPVSVFEWRSETRAALTKAGAEIADLKIETFDLDVSTLTPEAFAGLISFDDLTYAGFAPHLALQAAKALKAGAHAVMDCYVGPPGPDLAHAFASAFAEPQVRMRAELEHALSEAGFDFDSEEDLTEAHIALARARFEALPGMMTGADAPKLSPGAAREIAWETETWRVRLRMLTRRRLERRRFFLRRRG